MPGKKPDWNSQSKTAVILRISRQAVQKLCKGKFNPAVCKEGKEKGKVNLWHPVVQQHKADLEAKKANVSGPTPPGNGSKKGKSVSVSVSLPQNGNLEITFEDVENLTIKEIVERYGGIAGFKNYVDALDKMSAWKNKELKYEQARKKLIKKNPVARSLFSIVDIAFRRIVTEYPTTVTDQLIAISLGKKKTARIDAIALQEQALSKILKGVKREVLKGLDDVEKD